MSQDLTLHSSASAADLFGDKKQCVVSEAYGRQSGAACQCSRRGVDGRGMRFEERLSERKRDVKETDRGSGAVTCDLFYN